MKAVIAIPSVLDFYFTPRRAAALGALVLARELTQLGWDTEILNFPIMNRPDKVSLPECLGYLQEHIIQGERGPVSWFRKYQRFGPDSEVSASHVSSRHPDIICISSFAWGYAEEARDLALAIARELPQTPIIIGGHGPSALPEYFINLRHPVYPDRPLFSLVVAGEIEGSAVELTSALRGTGQFLDFRNNPPGDTLRPIAGESLTLGDRRSISAIFTRGCPRQCRFCSNHICHGREFRVSPPESWAKSIFEITGENHAVNLNIEDDNILYCKKDFFGFLTYLKSQLPGISFVAENGLDYLLLDKGDIRRLKELGFIRLNLSLAVLSGSTGLKESRESDPAKLSLLIQEASEHGLPVTTHFISGLSGDSADDIIKTLLFLDGLPTQIGISNFYPVPGLPDFSDPAQFLAGPPRLSLGSSVFPWTGSLTTAQMITAFRLARWSNFRKVKGANDELSHGLTEGGRLRTVVGNRKDPRLIPVPNLDNKMAERFIKCR